MSESAKSISGKWYSTFKSPTGSIHYFTLELDSENWRESTIGLEAKRIADPDKWARPQIAIVSILPCDSVPAVTLLAQETENPEGVFSMIIKFDQAGEGGGRVLWLSLTDKQVRAELLFFSRTPSSDHPAASNPQS